MDQFGWDTIFGIALGVGAVYLFQSQSDDSLLSNVHGLLGSGSSASQKNRRRKNLRNFQEEDLRIYDGSGDPPRPCYVAVEGEVFDVSEDRKLFAEGGLKSHLAGKEAPAASEDVNKFREKYILIGNLIKQREFTVDELLYYDGQDGKPIYISAKGIVFDVTPGSDFYGPEGVYSIMAGRDASRALARFSLDQADIENTRIDDLKTAEFYQLDGWIGQFEFKYTRVGTLKDWTPQGSPKPSNASKSQNGSSSSSSSSFQSQSSSLSLLPPTTSVTSNEWKNDPTFLKKERQSIRLSQKTQLSHDTYLFRFGFPDLKMRLGLPIGKHIKFWCPNPTPKVPGEHNGRKDPEAGKAEVERKYTPASLDSTAQGYFDLVIKVYRPNEKFCDGGKMSQYLESLEVGDGIDIAGPFGLIEYKGNGDFFYKKKSHPFKSVGMIAGGTGVTPMLQLIQAVLLNPSDPTKLSLLFANQTEDDILLRDMLEGFQRQHPDRFKLHYTLDRPPAGWQYSQGFVNDKMINENLPPPGDDTVILMCGPPPMIEYACKPNLAKIGHAKERVLEF